MVGSENYTQNPGCNQCFITAHQLALTETPGKMAPLPLSHLPSPDSPSIGLALHYSGPEGMEGWKFSRWRVCFCGGGGDGVCFVQSSCLVGLLSWFFGRSRFLWGLLRLCSLAPPAGGFFSCKSRMYEEKRKPSISLLRCSCSLKVSNQWPFHFEEFFCLLHTECKGFLVEV